MINYKVGTKFLKRVSTLIALLVFSVILVACDFGTTTSSEVEFQVGNNSIQWRLEGDSEWIDLIDLDLLKGSEGLKGEDGREVQFKTTDTHVQWRYVGDELYNNLIDLSQLKGTSGTNGLDGISVVSAEVNELGHLILTLSNDTTIDAGLVVGLDGIDGREVEFHVSDTHIQWRYKGEVEFTNLIELALLTGNDGIDGLAGNDGREVEFNLSLTHIQWRYVGDELYNDLIDLAQLKGTSGINGLDGISVVSAEVNDEGHLILTLSNDTTIDAGLVLGLDGVDGREVEFNVSDTHIQWRYKGEVEFTNLIALELLTGADGIPGLDGSNGREVEFNLSLTHIQYRYVGDPEYTNLVELSTLIGPEGLQGEQGISVVSALINDEGHLILTLSNESTIDAGRVLTLNIVQFVDHNGYLLNTQFVLNGQAALAPNNPNREGHTFDSWDISFDNVTSDLVVEAVYTVNSLTVTFDELNPANVLYGETLNTLPEAPHISGSVFNGWYLEDNTLLTLNTPILTNLNVAARYTKLEGAFITNEDELINAVNEPLINTVVFMNDITLTNDLNIDKQFNIYTNKFNFDLDVNTITFSNTTKYEEYVIVGIFLNGSIVLDNTNGHFDLNGQLGTTSNIIVNATYQTSAYINGIWNKVEVNDTRGVTYINAQVEEFITRVSTIVVIKDNYSAVIEDIKGDSYIGQLTQYKVTFINGNDETVINVNRGVIIDELIVELAKHEFVGWFDEEDNLFDFNNPILKDVVLVAKFILVEVDVTTELELLAALNNEDIRIINLLNDIDLIEKVLIARNDITLNGHNHVLSLTSLNGWNSDYIIQAYDVTGIVINDLTFSGGDAALLVNGSEVVVNNITMVNQEFGGIEVSQGVNVVSSPLLTVKGELSFDSMSLPAVWIDGFTHNDNNWVNVDNLELFNPIGKNQLWFVNSSFEIANVASELDLVQTLNNEDIRIINLLNDIDLIEKVLIARNDITLNGHNHVLSLTSLNGWNSDYIIQAYDVTGIVINDLTFSGGDAALLVNGSEVVVNNITMVNQEFGGIEVSKGAHVLSSPSLKVTGQLSFDSVNLPAVWIDQMIENNEWVIQDLFTEFIMNDKNQVWFTYLDFVYEGVLNHELNTIYDTITAAISNARSGDNLTVSEGTFNEVVIIDKALTLRSYNGSENTTINASGANYAVQIATNNLGVVTVEGFSVVNWTRGGINQPMASGGPNSSFRVIGNNVISPEESLNHGNAIQVSGDNSVVIGNTITVSHLVSEDYFSTGILVVNASNVLVEYNVITGSDVAVSVQGGVFGSKAPANGVEISNNVIEDIFEAIVIQGNIADLVIFDNDISLVKHALRVNYNETYTTEIDLEEVLKNNKLPEGFRILENVIALIRTVSFESNGGSLVDRVEVVDGESILKPVDPNKLGYTFNNWFTTEALTEAFDFGLSIDKDLTLYAKWDINEYRVTYEVDGEVYQVDTYDFGSEISILPEPVREGYTFSGWDIELPNLMPADNIVVTGTFNINTYQVTFTIDEENKATVDVIYNNKVSEPDEPERAGYTFAGWLLDDELFDFDTLVKSSFELTASWTVNEYSVTYRVDGEVYQVDTYDFGSEISILPEPVREGYTFSGWDIELPNLMPANDILVTGTFTKDTVYFNVVFMVEGEEYLVVQVIEHESVLEPEEPTKDGHRFLGWFTENSEDAFDFMAPIDEDIHLIARWEELIYVRDESIIYDFSDLTEKGTLLTNTTATNIFENMFLNKVEVNNYTYDGNGAGGIYPQTDGLLKFGNSSNNGELTIYLKEEILISKVVIYADPWNVSSNLTLDVNDVDKTISGQGPTRIEFDLLQETSKIQINLNARGFIFKIELYGAEAEIVVPQSYDVTFDLGYEGSPDPQVVSVLENQKVDKPANPSRDGNYIFLGWFKDEETEFDFDDLITDDLVLVAKWEEISELEPTDWFTEDFEGASLPSSYGDGEFTSNNVNWVYGHSRDEDTFPIDGKGLMLRRASDSYLEFTIISDGGYLTFDYMKAFTGNANRQLEILVDGEVVKTTESFGTTSEAEATVYTLTTQIVETGQITIRIKNIGSTTTNRQTVIDNIVWSEQAPVAPEGYEVTFDLGYEDAPEPTIVTVIEGNKVSKPVNPIRTGHAFKWWALDGDEVEFDFERAIDSSLTLIAIWAESDPSELMLLATLTDASGTNSYSGNKKISDGSKEYDVIAERTAVNKATWTPKNALVLSGQKTTDATVELNLDFEFNKFEFDAGFWNTDARDRVAIFKVEAYIDGEWVELAENLKSDIVVNLYKTFSFEFEGNATKIKITSTSTRTDNTARVLVDNLKFYGYSK